MVVRLPLSRNWIPSETDFQRTFLDDPDPPANHQPTSFWERARPALLPKAFAAAVVGQSSIEPLLDADHRRFQQVAPPGPRARCGAVARPGRAWHPVWVRRPLRRTGARAPQRRAENAGARRSGRVPSAEVADRLGTLLGAATAAPDLSARWVSCRHLSVVCGLRMRAIVALSAGPNLEAADTRKSVLDCFRGSQGNPPPATAASKCGCQEQGPPRDDAPGEAEAPPAALPVSNSACVRR